VEAPGIEAAKLPANTKKDGETERDREAHHPRSKGPKPLIPGDRSVASEPIASSVDVVEAALADAIVKAAAAGAFEVLPPLVGELEARRRERSAAFDLAAELAKLGRS
jgi:hypothetical protein